MCPDIIVRFDFRTDILSSMYVDPRHTEKYVVQSRDDTDHLHYFTDSIVYTCGG